MKHEQREKKDKVLSQLGYGIMWVFLASLLEVLFYLGHIQKSFYHLIALTLVLAAIYKFIIGFKKYQKLKGEFGESQN